MGALFGVIVGLPALRLRTFYFAMTTLGFATIVTQVALAWKDVTGGGVGTPGPAFPWPFEPGWGFYYFCFILAALATWMTANIGASRFGRALVAIRDAEVAAEASGISKPRLLVLVFLFAGALGGVAGGLFASLQSYITPDAFTFEMSVLFFIAILIGGRGSILGPAARHHHPDGAARVRGAAGAVVDVPLRRAAAGDRAADPGRHRRPARLQEPPAARRSIARSCRGRSCWRACSTSDGGRACMALKDIALRFGGVRAIDGLDLEIRPGEVHGLIGPNGSGKTTTLNVISGYYAPQAGTVRLDGADLPLDGRTPRASYRIARTFQTPRIDRRRIGARERHDRRHDRRPGHLRRIAAVACRATAATRSTCARRRCWRWPPSASTLADVRADRLQHSELRFMEIARALMLRPAFLLLDEPAAGLSAEEITRLGALIKAISREGTGVLLVEHHADLIFDICDRVTVLNLGKVLAAGTPAEIRSHREVVSAYLGA